MHGRGVIHADLKSVRSVSNVHSGFDLLAVQQNILISEKGEPLLAAVRDDRDVSDDQGHC